MDMSQDYNRVDATPAALELLRKLTTMHGQLLFHQSGGCCDGSAPMCYSRSEFMISDNDVLLGTIEDTPFYMNSAQFDYWKHTFLTLDIVPGCGGFSLEASEGVRFLIRSRLLEESDRKEGSLAHNQRGNESKLRQVVISRPSGKKEGES